MGTLVLAVSIALRFARVGLSGIDNPTISAWPSQVIFGIYFAVLTVAAMRLANLFHSHSAQTAACKLFLLVIVGLCSDLVLVNITETIEKVDSSYGVVALWDTATFFVWLRAIDSFRAGANYRGPSTLLAVAPVLKLGREIMFLPYVPVSWPAYADLVFGDLSVCAWAFAPPNSRLERILRLIAFVGCIYWLCSAAEHVVVLACYPLEPFFYHLLSRLGVPRFVLNLLLLGLAIGLTFAVRRWNPRRIGTHFGL